MAGLKIDPETAEVDWQYRHVLDPYEVRDLTPEEMCIGRSYFARAPGSDIWVSFHDLPKETVEALWHRIHAGKIDHSEGWLFGSDDDTPQGGVTQRLSIQPL